MKVTYKCLYSFYWVGNSIVIFTVFHSEFIILKDITLSLADVLVNN